MGDLGSEFVAVEVGLNGYESGGVLGFAFLLGLAWEAGRMRAAHPI